MSAVAPFVKPGMDGVGKFRRKFLTKSTKKYKKVMPHKNLCIQNPQLPTVPPHLPTLTVQATPPFLLTATL